MSSRAWAAILLAARLTVIAVVILVGLGLAPAVSVAASTPAYPDVPPGSWARAAIAALSARGIVHGFPGGDFLPDAPVTRVQLLALLERIRPAPAVAPGGAPFVDLKPATADERVVAAAVAAGWVLSAPTARFAGAAPADRATAARWLTRALGFSVLDADAASAPGLAARGEIPAASRGAAAVATRLGLMGVMPSGGFDPTGTVTRAQAAVLLVRALDLSRSRVARLALTFARAIQVAVPAGPLVSPVALGASVLDAAGRPLPVPVRWSASYGRISATGLLRVPQARTVQVSASAGALSGRASVNVLPAPMAATILPGPASLVAGGVHTILVKTNAPRVRLLVSGPGGTQELIATPVADVARFDVTETLAGVYSVEPFVGSRPGIPATLTVVAAEAAGVRLGATRRTGDTLQLPLRLVDAFGNPVSASVALTLDPSAGVTVAQGSRVVARDGQVDVQVGIDPGASAPEITVVLGRHAVTLPLPQPAATGAAPPAGASGPELLTITASAANLHTGPGLTDRVVGQLTAGQTFPLVGVTGAWDEIRIGSFDGYVYGSLARSDRSSSILLSAAASGPLAGKVIYVDPGHGGTDVGTTAPNGVHEDQITLAIGLDLERLLVAAGAQVVLTRAQNETVPLRSRPVDANRVAADAFVSIHNNGYPSPTAYGTTTYYYDNNPESLRLAQLIQARLVADLGFTDRGVHQTSYWVLVHTDMPAALTEPAFLTNPTDAHTLESPSGQATIAQAIYQALLAFFRNPGQGE